MKSINTLIFIVIVLIFLGTVSYFFPKEGIDIGIRKLYFPTFEEMLDFDNSRAEALLEHLRAIEEELRLQRRRDSLFTDSLSRYVSFFETAQTRFDLPDNDPNFFNDFFAYLDSCSARGEITRVLHYGDSQIESDRITGYIRQQLQEKFGGAGPGLLPAVQPIPSFSVGQSASENIARYTIAGMHENRASHGRYGVLGQFGDAHGSNYIHINTRKNAYENIKDFQKIRLFTGRDTKFTAQLFVPRRDIQKEPLSEDASAVTVHTWNLTEPTNSFTIHTSGSGEIYGIAVDGNTGIAVDNIPFRGSSGTFFVSLNKEVMTAMLRHLNVRLIILQFGGNAVPVMSNKSSIENYCTRISKQIEWIKNIAPEAKILFVGPADMSVRVGGQLTTYPMLEALTEALKETVLQNGAAYWNMYQVMGGKNSMIEWVRHSPSLAAPDYIHFTARGVERIAKMFCETLMVHYDYFNFITNKESLTCENSQLSAY